MDLVGLLVFLVIGGLIGWVASLVMKTNAQMGLLANIAVGVVGSVLGGWLAGLLGLHASSQIVSYAIAVGGAVALIAILRMLGVFR